MQQGMNERTRNIHGDTRNIHNDTKNIRSDIKDVLVRQLTVLI